MFKEKVSSDRVYPILADYALLLLMQVAGDNRNLHRVGNYLSGLVYDEVTLEAVGQEFANFLKPSVIASPAHREQLMPQKDRFNQVFHLCFKTNYFITKGEAASSESLPLIAKVDLSDFTKLMKVVTQLMAEISSGVRSYVARNSGYSLSTAQKELFNAIHSKYEAIPVVQLPVTCSKIGLKELVRAHPYAMGVFSATMATSSAALFDLLASPKSVLAAANTLIDSEGVGYGIATIVAGLLMADGLLGTGIGFGINRCFNEPAGLIPIDEDLERGPRIRSCKFVSVNSVNLHTDF